MHAPSQLAGLVQDLLKRGTGCSTRRRYLGETGGEEGLVVKTGFERLLHQRACQARGPSVGMVPPPPDSAERSCFFSASFVKDGHGVLGELPETLQDNSPTPW